MDDDDVLSAYGDLELALNPLPPGLDWDYFAPDFYRLDEDSPELNDTENPAIEAVFDWGQPIAGDCPYESAFGLPFIAGVVRPYRRQPPMGDERVMRWPLPRHGLPRPLGGISRVPPAIGSEEWEICERV